jgi:hypothetical protein
MPCWSASHRPFDQPTTRPASAAQSRRTVSRICSSRLDLGRRGSSQPERSVDRQRVVHHWRRPIGQSGADLGGIYVLMRFLDDARHPTDHGLNERDNITWSTRHITLFGRISADTFGQIRQLLGHMSHHTLSRSSRAITIYRLISCAGGPALCRSAKSGRRAIRRRSR